MCTYKDDFLIMLCGHAGADTEVLVGWGAKAFPARKNILKPHPKLTNRWGARGSGGACVQYEQVFSSVFRIKI